MLTKEKIEDLKKNGRIDFSDRFLAISSSTTREGNSLRSPIDSARKTGLIPKKMFPASSDLTFDEYHDKTKITKEMATLGKEFLNYFQINYEKVYEVHYEELLKEDMLIVAGYAWSEPVNGIYPRCDMQPNHAFISYKTPKYFIFDNYLDSDRDYIKRLADDYDLLDYGYRLRITILTEKESIYKQVWNTLWNNGLISYFLSWFIDFNKPDKEPEETEPINPFTPEKSTREKIHDEALKWVGKDASSMDIAPDEVGCSESVSNIIARVIAKFEGGIISTAQLANTLDDSKLFRRTLLIKEGNIIISPRTQTVFGHAGIWTTGEKIISNDSATGLMKVNYDWNKWVAEFKDKRGLRILMWEAV